MPERTITEVFGANATQTATELRIDKAGLAAILAQAGFTFNPTNTNTLDELVAAIVCAGLARLTAAEREADPIARNVEFNYDPNLNFDSPTLDNQTYNRHTVEVVFYKPIATPKLNPSELV
jgi:hypothetical protein